MEIEINKEVFDYKESVFFGLTIRQLIFSSLAIGSAIGIYFLLNERIGKEPTSWLCLLSSAPFAFLGFFKYNGMYAGRFLIAMINCEILYGFERPSLVEHPFENLLRYIESKHEQGEDKQSKLGSILKVGATKSRYVFLDDIIDDEDEG